MKKLIRSDKPRCLEKYIHGTNNWKEVTHGDKVEIWERFEEMQGDYCAYCECSLKTKHIEHFRDKDGHPRLTFEWENLFGSCDNKTRCGNFKDSRKVGEYDSNNIIKPDDEDASDYLIFLVNGHVKPRSDLDEAQTIKAMETIRVFNLDRDTSLVSSRRAYIAGILPNIQEMYEMLEYVDRGDLKLTDWQVELDNEVSHVANQEFQTALQHAWKYNQDR